MSEAEEGREVREANRRISRGDDDGNAMPAEDGESAVTRANREIARGGEEDGDASDLRRDAAVTRPPD